MNRREFVATTCGLLGAMGCAAPRTGRKLFVQTVLGPIAPAQLGRTLPHEHVMCDFIGAAETGRHRWNVDAVVNRMTPFLADLKRRGVTGLVDCTPAWIGRDPRVLVQLAEKTGMHILTNTGYYGGAADKYVPKHAYAESIDQLAARWIEEWREGIEGTAAKPGFIKTGVDEIKGDKLSEIDEKLVRAAARASKTTGLSAVCHTGGGAAGVAATKVFIEEGAAPQRFIVAHSDGHGSKANEEIARLGSWVSFDGISRRPVEEHVRLVRAMIEHHAGSLLLSQDNGWFWVGQPDGGQVRDFNFLQDKFLPAVARAGVPEAVLDKLTVENPARAFSIKSA